MEPTSQQKLIIEYDDNAVVIAAPGSGKTYVLSEKIKKNLKLLNEYQGVVAISYTNKASNELKNRSLSNGEKPMSSFFGTIDRFFLSEIVIPFGKQLFGIPDSEIKVIKINSLQDIEEEKYKWLNRKITLVELTNEQLIILKNSFLSGIIIIEAIGVLADYIISNSIACKKYIKSRYKYIYIDEYQDSGFEQHRIFLTIKKLGIKSVAVGDLNQSIYAFSGKDAKYLTDLTMDETFKLFKLDKNHRCDASIINYSNYLLNKNIQLIATDKKAVIFKRIDGDEEAIVNWIDTKIDVIQKTFKIAKRSLIAILTRYTRTCEILNSKLNEPHKFMKSSDLDMNLNIWSCIFTSLLQYCFDTNFKFIDVIEIFTSFEKITRNNLEKLNKLKININNIINDQNKEYELLIDEFVKIANIIAPNSKNMESIELLKNAILNENELKSYEPAYDNEINILTLHKSKGLEFDLSIHLDLYEWVFPNKRPGPNNDFNNPLYGDWQQDLNLHYVGITRAKKGVILISSTRRTNNEGVQRMGRDSEFLLKDDIGKLRINSN